MRKNRAHRPDEHESEEPPATAPADIVVATVVAFGVSTATAEAAITITRAELNSCGDDPVRACVRAPVF